MTPDPLVAAINEAIYDWPAEGPQLMAEFIAARLRDAGVRMEAPEGDPDYMCPNCVTPWKCNGPHIPEVPHAEDEDDKPDIGFSDEPNEVYDDGRGGYK